MRRISNDAVSSDETASAARNRPPSTPSRGCGFSDHREISDMQKLDRRSTETTPADIHSASMTRTATAMAGQRPTRRTAIEFSVSIPLPGIPSLFIVRPSAAVRRHGAASSGR